MKLVVTGTDTGVGKTWVTAALARAMRARGHVWALKPMETGLSLPGSDAHTLAEAAGHPPRRLVGLSYPASPERAARLEGVALDLPAMCRWIAAHDGPVLVEGVGGFEVPLTSEATFADLCVALGWPVLVVAANRLGVLNHTLLTVGAVRARGLTLAGVVLNDVCLEDATFADYNAEDLSARVPLLRVLRGEDQGTAGARLLSHLAPAAE